MAIAILKILFQSQVVTLQDVAFHVGRADHLIIEAEQQIFAAVCANECTLSV